MPATRAEARARLIAIDDGIAAIRHQIGAADLKRQASRTPIDPTGSTAPRPPCATSSASAPSYGS